MFNLKIVIGFASFALIITLLAGVFGGVPFGALLIRILLGSAAFAGLGVVASWVLHRHLPEVFDIRLGRAEEKTEEGATGESIDIVLPEENPHLSGDSADSGGMSDERVEAPGFDEDDEEVATDGEVDAAEPVDPDLDNFANLGNVPGIEGIQEDYSPMDVHKPKNAAVEALGVGQDPEIAAKAIKTWLNKDKEG